MKLPCSVVSLFLGLGVMVGAVHAQSEVVFARSTSRYAGIGDADIGVSLNGALSGSSRTGTFPGLPFQPTQLTARVLGTATPRLFGASREAVFADGQVNYSDGLFLRSMSTGALTSFLPRQTLSARAVLRIAGQTVLSTQQTASLSFDRSARYPLFMVSTPAFSLGGVSFDIGCDIFAVGHYHGGMTIRPRSGSLLPYVLLDGHAHGYVDGSARASIGIASVRATIVVANTHVDANAAFGPNWRSGRLGMTFEAVRLYIRACVDLGFWDACRTFYDRTFGGASWSWSF